MRRRRRARARDPHRASTPTARRPTRASSRAFPPFEPALPARSPADSLGYLGIRRPRQDAIERSLAQASAEAPGIWRRLSVTSSRAAKDWAASTSSRSSPPSLGDEAGWRRARRRAAAGRERRSSGRAVSSRTSTCSSSRVDEDAAADKALGALCRARSPTGARDRAQAPGFSQQQSTASTAHSLRVSPTVELTYAIFDSLAGDRHRPGRASRPSSAATAGSTTPTSSTARPPGFPSEVSLLGYLNLDGLVALGEQRRPGRGPGLRDLRRRLPQARGARARRSQSAPTCSRPDARLAARVRRARRAPRARA